MYFSLDTEDCYTRFGIASSLTLLAMTGKCLAKELNIKIHFQVMATLEHATYALVEADSVGALSRFFGDVPFPQMSRVVPVEHFQDVMKRMKKRL